MADPLETIKVSKLDAARRHLATAIRLWFQDGDQVSIHTLAYAAYEVIHVLSRKANRKDALLFDNELIKEEFRAEFNKTLKLAPNFFKHADKDTDTVLAFVPQFSEMFLLFSVYGLETMGQKLGGEEKAFLLWLTIHNPDTVSEGAFVAFLERFPVKTIDEVKLVPKAEFFKHVTSGHMASLRITLRGGGK